MGSQVLDETSVQYVLMKTIQAPLNESMRCAGERERERHRRGGGRHQRCREVLRLAGYISADLEKDADSFSETPSGQYRARAHLSCQSEICRSDALQRSRTRPNGGSHDSASRCIRGPRSLSEDVKLVRD
jgi:hypothetical protein